MGVYLNPGRQSFQMAVNSEIFVDKTDMIGYLNSLVNTQQRYVCVSRPRRFGKTMATEMICAYYGREAHSREMFEKRKLGTSAPFRIAGKQSMWDEYLGSFDVVRIVMTDFMGDCMPVQEMIAWLTQEVSEELMEAYPDIHFGERIELRTVMNRIYGKTGRQFVIVIDEWDAVFREYKEDKEGQKRYLDFLRDLLKDKEYVSLAYITGILPIKKYGKHSALNMFGEYSMTLSLQMTPFMGFTAEEVREECSRRQMNYAAFQKWYDGYRLSNKVSEDLMVEDAVVDEAEYRDYEVYSPYSVVQAIINKRFENYWNQTETYEALKQYIDWNFDGLKEDIAVLMNGGHVKIDITGYQNDMTTFNGKDDILTMLIHLGYLGYDRDQKEVFIPNKEVMDVFKTSTKSQDWTTTFRALENSRKLLEATWALDEETTADLIEAAHNKAGNRTCHSEAGLSYAIQLAYYAAQDYYTVIPEMDTGKGYADLVFLPKNPDIPAILVELKYEKDAESAITQIHRQKYPDRLEHYRGNLILVGISYTRETKNDLLSFKHHSCRIEKG